MLYPLMTVIPPSHPVCAAVFGVIGSVSPLVTEQVFCAVVVVVELLGVWLMIVNEEMFVACCRMMWKTDSCHP